MSNYPGNRRPQADKQQSIQYSSNATGYDRQAEETFPAEFHMISGCHDSQTSADVSNLNTQFSLPNPQGRAGGACTASLLSVLYEEHRKGSIDSLSWVNLLRNMRQDLLNKGFDQVPQLTSSRLIDVNKPLELINKSSDAAYGTKRAVMIGINYRGQQGELSGCHNDVKNMVEYLKNKQGFQESNMTILMDDGYHTNPTYSNIMNAYRTLVRTSQKGDTVFIHYSGHGGRVRDLNGDEDDGFDETLIPVDFKRAGQIVDDDLCKELVKAMPRGVLVTSLMDCCHSGTVLDLPYRFTADGEAMVRQDQFDFGDVIGGVVVLCCCFELLGCLFSLLGE
mmetsp:Transcript_22828/g.25979  ORF Transcript_22828/g.25979 Transcript_22828/m.25979 type:complete len:336 (+) Transcript_22828:172-1179(+)